MNDTRPNHPETGGYARLCPVRSKPQGVLALAAASRVGAWAPLLPPRDSPMTRNAPEAACK